jgi:Tol biopolymer transport system component
VSSRWSRVVTLLVAGASAVVAVLVLAIAANGHAARLPANGVIAFVRGAYVYVVPARGGAARRLTRLPIGARPESQGFDEPAWSADGKQVAVRYSSNDPHEYDEIDVIQASGRSRRVVVDGSGSTLSTIYPSDPAWSPSGQFLAYRAGGSCTTVFIVNIATGIAHALGRTGCPLSNPRRDTEPAWSPNGSEIAFVRTPGFDEGPGRLYSIHPDGSGLRMLAKSPAEYPDWSPDGSRIAFDNGHRTLLVDAGGRKPPVMLGPGIDPAWSHDGRNILVVRGRDLWVIGVRGGQHLLARNASEPAWQPIR